MTSEKEETFVTVNQFNLVEVVRLQSGEFAIAVSAKNNPHSFLLLQKEEFIALAEKLRTDFLDVTMGLDNVDVSVDAVSYDSLNLPMWK
jgi:hypothetical protein